MDSLLEHITRLRTFLFVVFAISVLFACRLKGVTCLASRKAQLAFASSLLRSHSTKGILTSENMFKRAIYGSIIHSKSPQDLEIIKEGAIIYDGNTGVIL